MKLKQSLTAFFCMLIFPSMTLCMQNNLKHLISIRLESLEIEEIQSPYNPPNIENPSAESTKRTNPTLVPTLHNESISSSTPTNPKRTLSIHEYVQAILATPKSESVLKDFWNPFSSNADIY